MRRTYNEAHAKELIKRYPGIDEELILQTYSSRLLGADPSLALHGCGSSSVKLTKKNILGEDQKILFITGRGVDLAAIEPNEFVALDLAFLRSLRRLENIADDELEEPLLTHKFHVSRLNPPPASLLHAFLPHKSVDHTQADSILVLTNQKNPEKIIRDALGANVGILSYTMPGLRLAQKAAALYEQNPEIEAIVIINYGIFTFGQDTVASYERMIDYVDKADAFIKPRLHPRPPASRRGTISTDTKMASLAAGFAQIIRGACAQRSPGGNLRRLRVAYRNPPELLSASASKQAHQICNSGVLAPDHVARTKNRFVYIDALPEQVDDLSATLIRHIDKFVKNYHEYFNQQETFKALIRKEPDPYPRVFLAAGLGLFTLGISHREALMSADLAERTILAKLQAGQIGEYEPIADTHIFDLEYRLRQPQKPTNNSISALQGQIALITGSGGAIGVGIADRLLAAEAAVVLSDIDETRLQKARSFLMERYPKGEIELMPFDVSDYKSVTQAYEEISRRIGGLDIVVPNAGIAHVDRLEDLDPDNLDKVIAVNLKGTFHTIKAAIPVFKRQNTGGNIVVISSKNVFDPGAAFGAYSASKAGAHQIAKIAALELAQEGVRVNMINPDAVFGDEKITSKLWDLVGPDRMKSRGLDFNGLQEYYRNRNLLKTQVQAEHVGNAVVFFSSGQTPTTGASLPIDGGIPAAFPR